MYQKQDYQSYQVKGLEPLDQMKVQNNEKYKKNFLNQNEFVYFSQELIKINKAERRQKRTLIITDKALYNFDGTSMKKCIPYDLIHGLTVSSKSNEFVVHGAPGICYDYRYEESQKRDKIISYIVHAYNKCMLQDLRMWFVDKEILKEYFTQEKELQKKITLMPKFDHQDGRFDNLNIIMSNNMNPEKTQKVLFINDKNIYRVALESFRIRYILEEGSFCKSILIVHFSTEPQGKKFIAKFLPVSVLGKQKFEELSMQIQNHRNSPYIEQLEFAFKKHTGFYFLFKFMPGGDLLTHIHMQKQISESNAKIYFCQILLALNNFHQRKIIYGDLKPENVVIDEEGNMNLTDFGQCRCPDKDDDQFLNITLEYTAPEILKGEKRSFESDYWSLGCLLYEMVVGIAPYYNENTELVIYLITKNEIKFPTSDDKALAISNECKEVIQTLLNTNPSNRPGFDAIKNLPWLKEIQWIEFEKKRVLPEWKPANDGKTNPQYFKQIKNLKKQDKDITITEYYTPK